MDCKGICNAHTVTPKMNLNARFAGTYQIRCKCLVYVSFYDFINALYRFSNNWKAHQLIHTRSMETITPCDQCGKVFPDNRLMKTHKRITHAPYIASQCNECGKVFRNRKRLAAHMLLHGTPKIQCDHCKTMFKSKKYVIEHMRVVHGQGLPHVCDKCGQEFQNRYLGRKHTSNCIGSVNKLRRRHQRSESNSLNCRICMRPYLMLATLQNHYKVKHKPEEFENLCMQCNQVFESVEACSAHAETAHGLQCTVCKKICLSEAILRAHMEGHFGGKPRFSCEVSARIHAQQSSIFSYSLAMRGSL